ncbi:hypothetical protein HYZ97_03735 [Candidatus Pacearchaeota archaeon]|nr:hypothetical protein [Candidatus Pacearchaeota archaeon]
MFNSKRGEAPGIVTIITLIVAVIAAVVVLLYFTGTFDDLGKASKNVLGKDVQLKTSSCKFDVEKGLYNDYYNEFTLVEISGTDQLINCQHTTIQEGLIGEGVQATFSAAAPYATAQEAGKQECIKRIRLGTADNDLIVNDVKCSVAVSCVDAEGTIASLSSCNAGETTVTKGFRKTTSGEVCCIPPAATV